MTYDPTLLSQAKAAKAASRKLAGLSTTTKNAALEAIAVAARSLRLGRVRRDAQAAQEAEHQAGTD